MQGHHTIGGGSVGSNASGLQFCRFEAYNWVPLDIIWEYGGKPHPIPVSPK